MAETPAGALLEVCVHTTANDVPPNYTLLAIDVPRHTVIESLDSSALGPGWTDHLELTREAGSKWLRSLRSAMLRVPSALVPATFNVLLNPLHADARQLRIEADYTYPFDLRLKK